MKELYKCTATGCAKAYVSQAILKRHILAFHSPVNKFQCKTCNKLLASRQNLKEHMFIHSGEKPYKCSVFGCQMSFRQGTHLSMHRKLHQKLSFNLNAQKLWKDFLDQELLADMSVKIQNFTLPAFRDNFSTTLLPNINLID
ncbi:hypothetical protein SteCoe_23733 [Stentor coeruleus]|uniref:C2H2-type domain-containing protein n=1 Tax=Stentor coeruleus TaxID=5963 RepID=A0A1R2BJ69_9CILI|nr:hypothetical protein SteCoe_23733 [Stentor coeruleus]